MNRFLLLAFFLLTVGVSGQAMAQAPGTINQYNAVCDPGSPKHCLAPNSSGAMPVTGTISASSSEHSTAAAPSYSEGTDNALSGDLSGNLRTISGSGSTTAVTQTTASNLNATVVGAGSAGSANAGVETVQGIASMTPILTNPGTAANIGVGATGSGVPANAVYQGVDTGGNLTGQIKCQNTAVYDASTNGSTQLVALSSGKVVYVCGFNIMASGTVNVKLIYGTGTACVTSPGNVTPAYQLTAQAGIVDDPGIYQGLNAIASNELCINTSGGIAVQAIVYYTQF